MAKKPAAKPTHRSGAGPRAGGREVEVRPDAPALAVPKLARRVSFGDLLGQDRALAALRASLASGRIHHAWIFDGPPGIGKFSTALAFAGALLAPTTGPG
jgi:DNA polymerase-3 subunit delta'